MTGFGPRLQPDDQARSPGKHGRHREALAGAGEFAREREAATTVGTWASQQAYKLGAEHERARLRDPQTGYDVGYSANLDNRAYVHAVIRGFEHGSQARHELAGRLLEQSRPRPKPQPHTQPELEAEPG